jgi:peroxiredoxin
VLHNLFIGLIKSNLSPQNRAALSDEYQCLFISNIRYLFQKYVQKFLVIGIHRTTFVIDESGIIDEVISEVKTKAHAAQILK